MKIHVKIWACLALVVVGKEPRLVTWWPLRDTCRELSARLPRTPASVAVSPLFREWGFSDDLWKRLQCFLPRLPGVAYLHDCRGKRDQVCSTVAPLRARGLVVSGVGRWQRRLLDECAESRHALVSIEPAAAHRGGCPVVRPGLDFAVPYPTHLRAQSDDALRAHMARVDNATRSVLVACLVGLHDHGHSAPFRTLVHDSCARGADDCVATQHQGRLNMTDAAILKTYMRSDFCLHPDGDTYTRQGWFDSLLCGCIPVFFADCRHGFAGFFHEHVYSPFIPTYNRTGFGPGDWAVVLNATEVELDPDYLLRELRAVPLDTRRAMRTAILEFLPNLQYSEAPLHDFADAADIYRATHWQSRS